MASNRGFDSTGSQSRQQLIEAAANLLAEEGYHAFSARRVAERAGLKPQLIHYYFRSTEAMLVAVFRYSSEQYLELHNAALAEHQPLRALWRLNTDRPDTTRSMAFMALGTQHPSLQREMLLWGEHFRKMQIGMIGDVIGRSGVDIAPLTPASLAMLLASVSRALVMEGQIGISLAHGELCEVVEQFLERIEPGEG